MAANIVRLKPVDILNKLKRKAITSNNIFIRVYVYVAAQMASNPWENTIQQLTYNCAAYETPTYHIVNWDRLKTHLRNEKNEKKNSKIKLKKKLLVRTDDKRKDVKIYLYRDKNRFIFRYLKDVIKQKRCKQLNIRDRMKRDEKGGIIRHLKALHQNFSNALQSVCENVLRKNSSIIYKRICWFQFCVS